METSTDPGHFFQTEVSLEKAARRAAKASNKNGDPITCTSKLLAILPDPRNPGRVYVAESGGVVRRVTLETGHKKHVYRGHDVPMTCLALDHTARVLFGGSWDKTITAWDTETCKVLRTFNGHADFVKSLLYIPRSSGGGLLLSGSSDATIIVWNASTGERLHKLRGHTRGVGTLALDPVESTADTAVVYAGGSEREIRRWSIPLADPARGTEGADPIIEHDTSVFKVAFMGEDADLWTASADFTARRLEIRVEGKEGGATSDTVLKHPDYVNDVVVEPRGRWVCTACRDEEVRVWDISSGALYHTFEGHLDEVSGLTIAGDKGDVLVSISIDCTIRRWSLNPADLKKAVEAVKNDQPNEEKEKEKEKPKAGEENPSTMTEEEERELAELMEESD